VGKNSPTINRIAIKKQEELEMKKSLVIGAATLAITAMVGAGFGSASSQDEKGESTLAVNSTAAVEATAEEIAAFEKEALEVKGTTPVKTTDAIEATPEEIAAFEKEIAEMEKNSTPAAELTDATEATAEEIAAREKEEASKK